MNKEQLRQKAIQHIHAMDTYNSIMIEVLLNPPRVCMGIRDLIHTYQEPQKTEQELLKERLQEVWPQW